MDFQDIFINEVVAESNSNLPLFKEYAIDFKTNEYIKDEKTNDILILQENEALRVWIYKALKTERFRHGYYSDSYGSELYEHIGTIYRQSVKDALMINQIKDCLLVNPYILECYSFDISKDDSDEPVIKFSVNTVYGEMEVVY